MSRKSIYTLAFFLILLTQQTTPISQSAGGTTYYVSSSSGSDAHNGLSEGTAFASITHVNSLNLQPGDTVLFKCGDTWRTQSLVVTHSGTAVSPITYSSYPANCANKPVFSGAQPVTGWSLHSGNIYVADLAAGGNAGLFQDGVNQLFQGEARLPFGRWPNLGSGNGGYSTIDSHNGSSISDNQLPPGNWSGARAHIKGMRWYILNRSVASSSGSTLTLNTFPDCWSGNCTDWGYFLSNHLNTLDQEGEWYYDTASHRVYLYHSGGTPSNIAGSVVITGADEGFHGGIILGRHLQDEIHYVVLDNLEVSRWFDNGVTTPRNLELEDNSHLTLRHLLIRDVDNAGIFFATWVWNAGPNSGWRGGHDILVEDNVIERANHTAVNSYTTNSTYRNNTIRDIALIENLGRDGMGCAITDGGGFCTRDGMAMRFPVDQPAFSGFGNTIEYNHLERTGSSGIQMFGGSSTIQYNSIQQSGYAKGDNGGISVYGSGNFATTNAHDVTIQHNIIISATGSTDGAAPAFQPLFGIGIYIDNAADNITIADNTVIGSTIDGILIQNSRASVTGNTVYNNNAGSMSRGQIGLYGSPTHISSLSNNILYGLNFTDNFTFAKTLHTEGADGSNIGTADFNDYFNPYRADNISIGFNLQTLAQWQANSGHDAHSTANWFTLNVGEPPLSRIFYNNTQSPLLIDLGSRLYLDLDQNVMTGSFSLAPFTSRILIDSGEVAISPDQLIFDDASSPPQPVTLHNVTGSPLPINNITITTHFSQTNNCPATLATDTSCTINVSYTPATAGPHNGTLTITHTAGEPYTVALFGGLNKTYLPIMRK
ncbi:MAG: choice-of-anchor D domain-containing protein [Ardenticatenaceae bacterium]|nr:choice-of-anchor D domain-containing protein [Ardenticatenaceae bacterium]